MQKCNCEIEFNTPIQLNSLEEVVSFISKIEKFDENIYAVKEKAMVNAKSIIGVLSLIGKTFVLVKSN